MLVCVAPHTARLPPLDGVVGPKPPWNQPHVMPLALSRSPMLRPVALTRWLTPCAEQSSSKGCGSPIIEPTPETGSGSMSAPAGGTGAPVVESTSMKPWVLPDTRLIAPGVDGPKLLPKKRSDIAKFWA